MHRSNDVRRHTAAYLNVAFAVACFASSLVLLAIPLVGLMFLPSLLGAACWASFALEDAGIID
jgi:hypothetical protein